ncbi:acyl-CoA synthetase (AMP-forming)/AMP-acid ligase II [Opitutaceae bacterium TAV1]|nr:acyl-CoA synthetase (AMP-forming)/AMP-acid ligase II [Opitutaceae bacterium TAV1]
MSLSTPSASPGPARGAPLFTRSHAPWLLTRPVFWFARLLYRVRTRGADRLPAGGALLLANHLSYVDVIVLQLACPRPIRFLTHEDMAKASWMFRIVNWLAGSIPVSPSNALEATRRVTRALQAGELVLLFPEGAISRTGQLMKLQRGFELMARKAGVPVVPVAHDGLWGSAFSFSGNRYLFKSPRLMRTHVFVAWGQPVPAAEATAAVVRQALLDLGYEAFNERPQIKRHLGREIVRGLARRPWAVELVDRTAAERRVYSAGKILAASAAYSRRLRRTLPDERRVGVVLPPGAAATIANLALLCAGKTPVNLNFTAGPAAIESSLRLAGIRTIITADAMRARLAKFPWPEGAAGKTLDFVAEMKAAGGARAVLPWLVAAWIVPNKWIAWLLGLPKHGGDAEAGLLFTSGSSGEPKSVVYTHRNILANCWQISSLSILPDTTRLLACLPMFHSFGFTVTLWYPMLRGCRAVTVPGPLDTKKITDTVREEEVTAMVGAPTFLRPLLKRATSADLRSLQVLVSGAEKLPDDLHAAFLDKFNLEILQGYGLTETSPIVSVNQPNPPQTTATAGPQNGKRHGTVGRLMPGMTARIIDPDTKSVLPADRTGILCLRGANVFGGYLDAPDKTAEVFHDGWFVTGDLGRFDDEGFLSIEGRLSRFSKIGGEMVPHGTLEQKLIELFDLEAADGPPVAIVGVPDATKGEALVLLTTQELTLEAVREKLAAAGLPNLWVPRSIVHVPGALPTLGSGKLDLKGCKDLATGAA